MREQPLGQGAPCQRPRPSRIAVSDSTTCSFKSATSAFSPVADKLSEPLGAQPKAAPAAANAAAVAPLRKKLRRLTLVLLFDDIDPPPIRTLTFPAKHLRANDLLSLGGRRIVNERPALIKVRSRRRTARFRAIKGEGRGFETQSGISRCATRTICSYPTAPNWLVMLNRNRRAAGHEIGYLEVNRVS